jgi:hypothetical protein
MKKKSQIDAPAHSLKDSNVSSKVKITKGGGVCSLVCSTLRVEGRAGVPRWGLGQMISGSIIHINLHKPNNKLVNVWLEHFWCINEAWAYINSQDSSRPRFGGKPPPFPL